MLDAEESAAFDDALRDDATLRHAYREMNALCAAIAAAQVIPLPARPGQLERLQTRLGLLHQRPTNWLGISGWAVAASLAMLLVLSHRSGSTASSSVAASPIVAPRTGAMIIRNPTTDKPAEKASNSSENPATDDQAPTASNTSSAVVLEREMKSATKVEAKRLIQEITVLREKLENVSIRDQKRFEIIPGRSWPVMMTMAPPSSTTDPIAMLQDAPALTSRVGDALAGLSSMMGDPPQEPATEQQASAKLNITPTAIPIYDPVTDHGAIVVAGLPISDSGMGNYLWVTTEKSDVPVLVGQLPPGDSQQPVSIDFTLGTKGILPISFVLTNGVLGNPASPSQTNTILLGPR